MPPISAALSSRDSMGIAPTVAVAPFVFVAALWSDDNVIDRLDDIVEIAVKICEDTNARVLAVNVVVGRTKRAA